MRPGCLPLLLFGVIAGCSEAPRSPNIILVSMDTLRADRLGVYGNPDGLSPNLDAFGAEGVVFEHAFSQANETLFSHASLFTGRYPSELGPLTYEFGLSPDISTLADVLGVYGYRTGAVVAGGHLARGFNLEQGFEIYEIPMDWGCLYHTVPPALAWLDSLDGDAPFFLFLHTYDNHQRYLKPVPFGHGWADPTYEGPGQVLAEEILGSTTVFGDWGFSRRDLEDLYDYRDLRLFGPAMQRRAELLASNPDAETLHLTEQDHAHLRAIYDGSVAYADAFFGMFMAGLEQRGLLRDTVIAVISDHGESLGERGVYNHRFDLADEDTHVVFMLRPAAASGAGLRVPTLVGLIDVLPTLLDIAGATPPAGISGMSLLPQVLGSTAPTRDVVFTEGAFRMVSARSDDQRLIFTGIAADSPFLADMLEVSELRAPAFEAIPEADPQALEPLRDQLIHWRRHLAPSPMVQNQVEPALLEALRERGYWGL